MNKSPNLFATSWRGSDEEEEDDGRGDDDDQEEVVGHQELEVGENLKAEKDCQTWEEEC